MSGNNIEPPSGSGGGSTDPEVVRDTIAAALVAGSGIAITPNDPGDTITIAATGGGSTDPEVVRDTIAAALVAGANVTITPNDPGDTITIDAATDPEVVRDTIAAALVAGSGVTITPNDPGDTITIAATGGGGGSVATDAIFDAKGDLPAGTGADAAAALPVGGSGSILLPNAAAATGLAWAPFMAPIVTGMYVQAWESAGNSNKATTLNELVFTPIFLPHPITADRIACIVHATGAAGAVVRLGIYTASATNGRPDSLVLDAGTVDSNASTGLKEITISQALGPGLVWLACVAQVATCSLRSPSTAVGGFVHWTNDSTGIQTPGANRWRQTGVSGALPSSATPVLAGNDYKHYNLWVRAA